MKSILEQPRGSQSRTTGVVTQLPNIRPLLHKKLFQWKGFSHLFRILISLTVFSLTSTSLREQKGKSFDKNP